MSVYEYFLIFLALAFCGYASYTDLKTQKIYNFCSLGLLYGGTLSQLMAWYLGTTTPLYILALFFGSGLIAFAFYWFGIFSPGDSKLFWGLCLIFPLSLFRNLSGSFEFPAVDTHAEYHHSVFSGHVWVSAFQICVDAKQTGTPSSLLYLKLPERPHSSKNFSTYCSSSASEPH